MRNREEKCWVFHMGHAELRYVVRQAWNERLRLRFLWAVFLAFVVIVVGVVDFNQRRRRRSLGWI